MFIRRDSFVTVTRGRYEGRSGRVHDIVVDSASFEVWVFVSMFSVEDGAFYNVPFFAGELKVRKSNYDELAAALLIEEGAKAPERRAA